MNREIKILIALALVLLSVACNKNDFPIPKGSDSIPEEGSVVKIEKSAESGLWEILVNGSPFQLKGAATNNFYSDVRKFGGNAIRLYSPSASDVEQILDDAYQSGLMVYMGLGMGAAKNFDYGDVDKVAKQKENILSYVKKYQHHPALLCWSLGNEIEASNEDNMNMWKAVGDLAASVKEIDPDHPITLTLASSAEARIKNLCQNAPQIDILSFNSYYPTVSNIPKNISSAGIDLPYLVTEFGPRGTWAMGPEPSRILPWGDNYSEDSHALVEETSTEKEAMYLKIYKEDIEGNFSKGCLGGFVFVWGYQKHGEVLNWYGTHTKDRYSFGVCDAMQYCWSGTYPEVRAPKIESRANMTMNGLVAESAIKVKCSSSNSAKVTAVSSDDVKLRYNWIIMKEGDKDSDGSLPDGIPNLITDNTLSEITFKAPSSAGAYRLYVFVYDDVAKKGASACIPFYAE